MPLAAALVTGFFLVAVPVILLMAIWAAITMWRVIFPDGASPLDRPADPVRPEQAGETIPVGLADILEEQRRRPVAPVMPHRQQVGPKESGRENPLTDDLWLRRN